jgi:hypothetical protein
LPTKTPHAEAITRRDILRLVPVGGSTGSEAPARDRAATVRPPPPSARESTPPASRKSAVRLKGADENALPYALVDVVTADFSKDPRREQE